MTDNTIHVSATAKMGRALMRTIPKRTENASFGSALADAENVNLDAYKAAFTEKVDAIEIPMSHMRDDMTIDITDEGYRAMQKDPEYEQWVLDTIRQGLTFHDPYAGISGGNSMHFHFGATKAEYRGDSWRKGDADMDELTGNGKKKSYWEERAERHEAEMALREQISIIRQRAKHAAEMKRIRGEKSTSTEAIEVSAEIMNLLMADFMGSL